MVRALRRSRRYVWLSLLGIAAAVLLVVVDPWSNPADDRAGPTSRATTEVAAEGAPQLNGVARPTARATEDPTTATEWRGVLPGPFRPPTAKPPSRTITGRVLAPDGESADRAQVSAHVIGDEPQVSIGSRSMWGDGPAVGEDGRFALEAGYGTEVVVSVTLDGALPLHRTFTVPKDVSADLGDLRLDAGVTLSGTVTVGGQPSAFGPASVWIKPTAQAASAGGAAVGTGLHRVERSDGGSVMRALPCDAEGRWRLSGLAPAPYEVQVLALDDVWLFGQGPPPRTVTAPASDVDFDVDLALLRVTPPADIAWLATQRWWIEWTGPDGKRMRVDQPWSSEQPALQLDNAQVRAALVPTRVDLDVRVQLEGFRAWTTRVRTPGAGEVLTVVAEPAAAVMGVVQLVRPEGKAGATADLTYQVFEPGTDALVRQGTAMLATTTTPQIRLPVGTHELVLRGPSSEWALEQRTLVEVSAHEPATVAWSPPKGARVRARLACDGGLFPRCTLVRPGHRDVLITGASMTRDVLERSLHPRLEFVNESPVVEPGLGMVRVEAEGFQTQEVPVKLIAGEFTDVSVRLEPDPSAPRAPR